MQTTVSHLSSLRFDLKVLCSEFMGFQDRSSEISQASPAKNFVVFLGESLCDATCIYILNHRFLGTPMTMETSIYSLVLMMGSSVILLADFVVAAAGLLTVKLRVSADQILTLGVSHDCIYQTENIVKTKSGD